MYHTIFLPHAGVCVNVNMCRVISNTGQLLGVEGVDLRPALEGCGETKWYARAASSHHCKAAFGFAFVVWRTTSAQIHVKR